MIFCIEVIGCNIFLKLQSCHLCMLICCTHFQDKKKKKKQNNSFRMLRLYWVIVQMRGEQITCANHFSKSDAFKVDLSKTINV